MRGWIPFGVVALATVSAAVPPPCPSTPATVTVFAQNLSAGSVDVTLDGNLVADAATCSGPGAVAYPTAPDPPPTLHCEGTGLVRCGEIVGLRPGAWVHRLHVTVSSTDPLPASVQEQAQRLVVIGGAATSNPLVWTIYPRTFVVANTNADASAGSLRVQLKAAADYTAANGVPALVTFSPAAFPGTIAFSDADPCALDPSHPPAAAICFGGSHVVIDGLDANAKPGSVIWSVGTNDLSVLRLYGSDDVVRGIVFDGTTDPDLPGRMQQQDTVALTGVTGTGPFARRDRVEQSIVRGPSFGDALSVDRGAGQPDCPPGPCTPAPCPCTAGDDVVADSELTRAADRGMKVDDGVATLASSCIHDNHDGGVQSTLGGDLTMSENVVQSNLPGTKNGGLTTLGTGAKTSSLSSQGDVVRFNGARGVSVTDNAVGWLADDYVANNDLRGSVVDTKLDVPNDMGVDLVPEAHFHGVAHVCNGDPTNPTTHGAIAFSASCTQCTDPVACICTTDAACATPGYCADTPADTCTPVTCWHRPPTVAYGEAGHPGLNAFTSNQVDNFRVEGVTATIPAEGSQWEHCPMGPPCDVTLDISPPDAGVDVGTLTDPRDTSGLHVRGVSPSRPRKGDIVRVYLDGGVFDAINGNPTPNHCDDTLPACSTDGDCTTGPCNVSTGLCACGLETTGQEVQKRNSQTGASRLRLLAPNGVTVLQTLFPDAVTPTMVAFTMPVDCFAPLGLQVQKKNPASGSYLPPDLKIPLCDPAGCVGTLAGVACDDGNAATTGDHCDGDGWCVGDPASTTTTTAPSSTTTSSTAGPSSTTVTTSTSTTTSTSPSACNPCAPLACDVELCTRPALRRRAERLSGLICDAIATGRKPKARWKRRLTKVLKRCGVPPEAESR
jgi:hypothetical protein